MLERFPNYWNKDAIHFNRIVYTPIPDATVRLANLRSGQLDFIERVASSDIAKLATESRFKVSKITEIGYQGITINLGKSDKAQANPLGKDNRVREAFELSLDRQGIVQVVMDGEAVAGNQWVPPTSAFYNKGNPVPKRDVAKAKALLKEAGIPNPTFTLMTPTTSDAQKIAQVVQAMAKEAGFDVASMARTSTKVFVLEVMGRHAGWITAACGLAAETEGDAPQLLQSGLYLSQMMACQGIDLLARHVGIFGQPQQAADLFQAETQVPAAGDEPDPGDVLLRVRPVPAAGAVRAGQQADTLVVADRLQMAAAGSRDFTNLHCGPPEGLTL